MKKLFILAAALITSLAVFAGCASKDNTSSTNSDKNAYIKDNQVEKDDNTENKDDSQLDNGNNAENGDDNQFDNDDNTENKDDSQLDNGENTEHKDDSPHYSVGEYNAVLYDNAGSWIDETFRYNNLVKGAYYDNFTYGENDPEMRTFIIDDYDGYEDIFVGNLTALEVDFEKDMLIVYTFAAEYAVSVKIDIINLTDKVLKIDYKYQLPEDGKCAVCPFQRWFVVKLDRLDIFSVEFVEGYDNI